MAHACPQTIFFWKPVGVDIASRSWFSSSSPSVLGIPGIRRSETIPLSGSDSNYCWSRTKWGISQRRADWFTRWSKEVASSPTIHIKTFEEGLGRIMFVAGALEHDRPFLGPLYKFLTLHPRNAVRRVPPYAAFSSTSFLRASQPADTATATTSWKNLVYLRGSTHKRAHHVLGSAAGSRTSMRTVQSINGCHSGSRWRSEWKTSLGFTNVETNRPT